MSSRGQIIGGIVGGIVGFFTVGVVQGAAIGMSIGGYIDPPPGPDIVGPTLDDKSFQSTAYGVPLPTLYGTIATTGNIIYLENNEYKAVAKKEQTGGKGGGPEGSYTTTTYYATFAIAIAEAMPGSVVRRIWAGGKLIFSVGSSNADTVLQSTVNAEGWHYYDGSQGAPDSRMESVLGIGRAPSFEGTAYIMFYDFDLTDYGNGLAGCPIKIELAPSVVPAAENVLLLHIGPAAPGVGLPSSYPTYTWCMTTELIQSHYQKEISGTTYLMTVNSNNASEIENKYLVGEEQPTDNYNYGETDDPAARFWDGPVENLQTEEGAPVWPTRFMQRNGVTAAFVKDSHRVYIKKRFSDWHSIELINVRAIAIDDRHLVAVAASSFDFEAVPTEFKVYDFDLNLVREFTINFDHLTIRSAGDSEWSFVRPRLSLDGDFAYFCGTIDATDIRIAKVNIVTGQYIHTYDISFATSSSGGNGARAPSYAVFGNLLLITRHNYSHQFWLTHYRFLLDPVVPVAVPLPDVVGHLISATGIPAENYNLEQLNDDLVDGYRVTGPGSARGANGPLQVAYLFDFVEHGYTLTAVKRGATASETIYHANLDARSASENNGVMLRKEYETASQLPSRYSITHLDYNREYDSNTQYADYPSRAVNERNEQMPIVLSAAAAAQLADVLINLAWVERYTYAFTLPQIYLGLRPGDMRLLEVSPGVFETVRITAVTYTADQRLEVMAKLAEPAVYQSSAVGAPSLPPPQTIALITKTTALLLDIPMILDSTDMPGYVLAMYGKNSWPGAVWLRSIDYGQTYNPVQAVGGASTIARCETILGADDGYVIDRESTLTVTELSGELTAITEAQMMTGQHWCAYGQDGRWEIMRFADCVLDVEGTKTLSTIIRGLRGTEWATGSHQVGDYLVLLDDPDNVFVATDLTAFGSLRYFKAVTIGQDAQKVEAYAHVYDGVNLRPLSPVLLAGEMVAGDWQISWTPRTRYASTYWVTGVQPQNEVPMGWELDIMDGDEIKRTLATSAPAAEYTEAQQIEDFGSAQTSITVNVYQKSERVGYGYPLEVTL